MNQQLFKEHFNANSKDYAIFVFFYIVPLVLNVIIFRSGFVQPPNLVFVAAATIIPVANWGLPIVLLTAGIFEVLEIIGGWILP